MLFRTLVLKFGLVRADSDFVDGNDSVQETIFFVDADGAILFEIRTHSAFGFVERLCGTQRAETLRMPRRCQNQMKARHV